MELEHMAYPEAIKWLGRKYGIEIKEKELTNEEKLQQNERESMFALNEWACKYFEKTDLETILSESFRWATRLNSATRWHRLPFRMVLRRSIYSKRDCASRQRINKSLIVIVVELSSLFIAFRGVW